MTLPLEARTLPNRTATYGRPVRRALATVSSSARRLVAPIAEIGSTALSVEMSTKRFTPSRSQAEMTFCEPKTLVIAPSAGECSTMGTCLRAAAWKTTSGRARPMTASTASWERMSARTSSQSTSGLAVRSASSRSIDQRASSWLSTMVMSRGPTSRIWRTSSLPIDPPPPVTRTLAPLRYPATASVSISTGARRSRSSTLTFRMRWASESPPSSSRGWGTVRTCRPSSWPRSKARRMAGPEAVGMATRSCRAWVSRAAFGSTSSPPKTRLPISREPCFAGSSSMKPTTFRPASGSRAATLATVAPVSPAP